MPIRRRTEDNADTRVCTTTTWRAVTN